jgi:phosphohistidine phosphatase
LYLVRHAIAWERDSNRWPGDRERPLTDAGISRFREAAAGLVKVVARPPDVMLASPLTRTLQTALLLSDVAGWPAPDSCEALEPDADAADLLKAIDAVAVDRDPADVQSFAVVLVGHEPGLGEIASLLVSGDPSDDLIRFKKGGVAKISISGNTPEPQEGTLRWLLTPRALRALAQTS